MRVRTAIQHGLRHTLRACRRQPGFVVGVVLTFALAIGANAAMFGLVSRLMLAPPPGVRDAEHVVRLELQFETPSGETYGMTTTSYPVVQRLADLHAAFEAVAAVRADSMTVGRGVDLTEISAVKASGSYFGALGAQSSVGRLFGPADDQLPDGNRVVVLSHAFWQRRYGGDRSVVGQEIVLDDAPYTIIGVAASGFSGTDLAPVDVFVPLSAGMKNLGAEWWSTAGSRLVGVVARLRDGVNATAAGSLVASVFRSDASLAGGDRITPALLSVVPGAAARRTPQGRIALWLAGVAIVVLLIATANVSTLLLLRDARQRRETAVQLAIGATPAHLLWRSLTESVVLSLAGCAAGLVLARWFGDAVRIVLLPNLAAETGLANAGVLAATLASSVGAGVLAGSAPLLHARRRHLSADLSSGSHGSSQRLRAQYALVVLQVTMCTVLLTAAGLFVRSLSKVRSQDLGFSTAHLLYADLDFRSALPALDRDLVHEEAVRRIRALPRVRRVTVVQGMPFAAHHIPPIAVPGVPNLMESGVQLPIMYGATPEYLQMMGVSLVSGRVLDAHDTRGGPLVVLVNESMARALWPGQPAIGKCVQIGYGAPGIDPMESAAAAPCRQVVGVVRDSRARSLRLEGNEGHLMQYYVPFEQLPSPPGSNFGEVFGILVESVGDPAALVADVQRAIQAASTYPVYARARPYQDLIDPQLRNWRLGATLFPAFGLLAVMIGAVGLFGVISFLVTQRTPEIGIRLALGGSPESVGRAVVRDAATIAGVGALAGVVLAVLAAPLVQDLLYQTSARDPVSLVVAVAGLLAVSVASAAVPAWRAARVSPLTALRSEG